MKTHSTPFYASILSLLIAVCAGCESSDKKDSAAWNTDAPQQNVPSTSEGADISADGNTLAAAGDAVSFGALSWTYGGVSGSSASPTSAQISSLRVSGDTLSYKWAAGGCETLGAGSSGDSSKTLACLFVKTNSGAWKGGKFDWISTSRTSRNLENVFDGYNGWSLRDVPNPCEAAFVIISADGKKRTNVITTSWTR